MPCPCARPLPLWPRQRACARARTLFARHRYAVAHTGRTHASALGRIHTLTHHQVTPHQVTWFGRSVGTRVGWPTRRAIRTRECAPLTRVHMRSPRAHGAPPPPPSSSVCTPLSTWHAKHSRDSAPLKRARATPRGLGHRARSLHATSARPSAPTYRARSPRADQNRPVHDHDGAPQLRKRKEKPTRRGRRSLPRVASSRSLCHARTRCAAARRLDCPTRRTVYLCCACA